MQVGLKPNMNPPSGFFSRFGSGFRAGLQGLGAIFREGLIIYALLPAAIGLLLGLALAYGTFTLLDYWLLQGLEASGLNDYSWLSWLSPFAAIISVIVSFFVYLGFYRMLISLLVFPLLGPMVDRLELQFRGQKTETTFRQDLNSATYGSWVGLLQSIAGFA
ncbi:MAG: hypothetical protein KDK37_18415, partial [Leptospiraceae bacterium]|nr:hypothetical protein [Leptospiraceae bacterium]